MLITLERGDITQIHCDAVVNAANSSLLGGGGVDGAIHRAGGPDILSACKKIREARGGCPTGEAVVTPAGNLPARYVIHTVGPVWQGGAGDEAQLLTACYQNALLRAEELELTTIAFPNISTGVYGYPKRKAAQIAVEAVRNHTGQSVREVIFVCFDEQNYRIYRDLLGPQG